MPESSDYTKWIKHKVNSGLSEADKSSGTPASTRHSGISKIPSTWYRGMIGSFSKIVNSITMSVVAGTGVSGILGEGGPALSAQLDRARGLGFDRTKENLYIGTAPSLGTVAGRILKMNLNTRIITRVAGDPAKGTALTGTGIVTSVAGTATSVTYTLSQAHTFTVGQSVRITDMPSGKEYLNLTGLVTGVSPAVNPTTVTLARTGGTVETLNLLSIPVTGLNAPASIGTLAVNAGICNPYNIVTDSSGNIYFPNQFFNNSCILKVDTDGYISRYSGNGATIGLGVGHDVDRLNTTVKFGSPRGIAIDSSNNIYVADSDVYAIRKIDAVTRKITTIVGSLATILPRETTQASISNAKYPTDGALGVNVYLRNPTAVAVDSTNSNLYIADNNNAGAPEYHGIYRYNFLTGKIYIINQSSPGYSGDGGPARDAKFAGTRGIVLDNLDNIYISESGVAIRKIDYSGIITTYTDSRGYDLAWHLAVKSPSEIYCCTISGTQVLVTSPYSRYV